jgi:ABC-type lipoprotein release transport system permease subunit
MRRRGPIRSLLGSAAALMPAVALIATVLPAHAASRANPALLLRPE